MKALLIIVSLFFLGACAHHKGHHGHKSKCGSKCEKKWNKMDTNKDGKVSKEEFVKSKTERFMEMDADKDGAVTKEEKMAYKKMKHSKKKECKSCK